MNNSTKRRTSLLLAALLITSAVTSCGSDTDKPAENTAANGTAAATEAVTLDPNDPASAKDSLPDGLDFEGKTFRIYNAIEAHQIYYEASE